MSSNATGIIVGSAFQFDMLQGFSVAPVEIETPFGNWTLYETSNGERRAYISFRHGHPHTLLPNQIPYRAQAWAFHDVQCRALLVTSSVGVLNTALPLYRPLLVGDILTLDNRLPDGSACTMFVRPGSNNAHLVLKEGLISAALTLQLKRSLATHYDDIPTDVVFGYVGGPRTKTRVENRMWKQLGAQVNSMTLAPEIILANELEIPCCSAVVGHKYSVPEIAQPEDRQSVTDSFERSREALERIVIGFISETTPVAFGNHLYRYAQSTSKS